MKKSISNIAWKQEYDEEMYQLLRDIGYEGIEIAPTRIFQSNPYERLDEAKQWKEEVTKKYDLEISSMQSIWYGRTENLFNSEEEYNTLIEYTKKAVDFASVIQCNNLVFGCPKNRSVGQGQNTECAVPFFKEIGDYAYSKGTVIGMEANPTIYNTNYINTTKEALDLIHRVDSKGFKLNLDFGTIIQNNESVDILSGDIDKINHIHISEPNLQMIKKRESHQKLAALLKDYYRGFVSIEMGTQDDIESIKKVMLYVKEIF